jgi:hypothetical protein
VDPRAQHTPLTIESCCHEVVEEQVITVEHTVNIVTTLMSIAGVLHKQVQ